MDTWYHMDDFFSDPGVMTGLGALIGFLSIFLLIIGACALVLYILRSIGLYKLAENRGMSNPGLAWIPLVGMFRAGSIADDISEKNGSKTYFRFFILGGYLFSWIFSGVSSSVVATGFLDAIRRYQGPGLGRAMIGQSFSSLISLVGLVNFIIIVIALNKIYKCYNPAGSTSYTVLSVIFPFMQSIFLFTLRDRPPTTGWYGPQQNYYPPAQPQNWQAPPPNAGFEPPAQYTQQPGGYYPPQAPNPPEPWDIADTKTESPPAPPWDSGGNPPNGD